MWSLSEIKQLASIVFQLTIYMSIFTKERQMNPDFDCTRFDDGIISDSVTGVMR